jgi:methanogenic corrinoid protein MtbC1
MSDKIAFDTNSPEPTRARADFTYKTTSPVISMVDTGLGKFSVTEDIKAVLRKIEYRRQGSTATFKIMCREVKDSGTEFSGMAKTHPFWLCRKPTSEKLARNYWPKLKTSERALAPPDPASFLRRSGLVLDRTPAERRPKIRRLHASRRLLRSVRFKFQRSRGNSCRRLYSLALKVLVKRTVGGPASQPGVRKRPSARKGPASFLNNALAAIKSFDGAGLVQTLNLASTELTRPAFLRQTVAPLIEQIGIYWQSGQIEAIQEHLATAIIRTFLGNLLRPKALGKGAPRIVFTTPPAELHELGALLAAATADYQGWEAIYLGPSLPSDAIARGVRLSRARAVGLSIVYPEGPYGLEAELKRLRLLLPPKVVLFTGGRAVPAYRSVLNEIEAIQLQDLSAFGAALDTLLRKQKHQKGP